MDIRKGRSRTALDALLKQRRWEREALSLEAARALRVWEERNGAHGAVLESIAGAESQLRQLYEASGGISLQRRSILEVFLKHQHHEARQRQQAAASARALYAQTLAQLEASRVAVKVLEKHEERSQRTYDDQERRRALQVQDDLWLLRRRSR